MPDLALLSSWVAFSLGGLTEESEEKQRQNDCKEYCSFYGRLISASGEGEFARIEADIRASDFRVLRYFFHGLCELRIDKKMNGLQHGSGEYV